MDKLKLIKGIVFFLTFLLVFGTLLLMGSIYAKTHSKLPNHEITYNLEQPQGSIISEFKIQGDEIYMLIKNGGVSDRIIIYNRQIDQASTTVNLN